MSTIHFHLVTTATPEQFLAALTDFGPDRSKLFPNSQDQHLKVHYHGVTDADVTEGTGSVWERLYYDWSDPNRIVVIDTDSNVWSRNSGYTYTLTPQPDGTTDVDIVIVRDGKNVKGWVIGFVLGTVGKSKLVKAHETTIKAIEARKVEMSAA